MSEEAMGRYFEESIWYPNDLNRDKQQTYDEVIQNMSHDDALEYFDLIGKDPTTEVLTFDEVK